MSPQRRRLRTSVTVCHLAILIASTLLLTDTVVPVSQADPVNCAAPGEDIGVAGGAELMRLSDAELARELDLMRAAGVRRIRVGAEWSTVERVEGQQDWSQTDRVVDAALERGMQVLGVVLSSPSWAVDPTARGDQWALPADPATFGRFAGDAAAHYAGRITAWEIWNEPNIPTFARPKPDVAAYAAMLSAAAEHIRGRVPGVTLITAGLAPAGDDGQSIAPTTFLEQLYRVGDRSAWDAVGMHPYTYPALPDSPGTADWNAFQRISLMRGIMEDHGDGAKRIWLTEFGAPTGGQSDAAVSEADQARAIRQAIERIRSATYFGPIFIHQTRDRGADPDDVEDHFGLLRLDFSEKPAYHLVSEMTRRCQVP
ncbi:hypothetical protein [Mycobacterium sp. ACS4331]|uniref:hypothetical protein n=1 Tax=Mycobacterium sp. ACS4331 TaxID=1834121 RepID=UPI0007FFE51A|nr:hypothetical protein [Mycobacterium sp. ACS4331]OBF27947.1 hypothetical protein A5727_02375 [Mycobacterium sp. ACS4331]